MSYGGLIGISLAAAIASKREIAAFENLCASVSPEEEIILREERKARHELLEQRRHEIRVAEAGKSEVKVSIF